MQISMAAIGKAEENGYAERLMRTIKEEEGDLLDYQNCRDAYIKIGRYMDDVYTTKRIHLFMGYLTPIKEETAFNLLNSQQVTPIK